MSYIPIGGDIHPVITSALMEFAREVMRQNAVAITLLRGAAPNFDELSDEAEVEYASNSMLFARAADNFQTYIVDLLLLIYTKHPFALYRKSLPVSRIFESEEISEIRRETIEREVAELSYKKLEDLNSALDRELGHKLIPSTLMLRRLGHLLNIRNVITHNRGVINSFSKARLQHSRYEVGKRIVPPSAPKIMLYLFHCAKIIDAHACTKFNFRAGDLWRNKDHAEKPDNG